MVVTMDQRQEALEVANEIRVRLAGFKRQLAALGRHQAGTEAADTLLHRHELINEMEVYVFLLALPGFGPARMKRVCQQLPVWPFRTISDLTERERQRLAAIVRRPIG